MIHVCFGLHDRTGRYSKFTGTAMLSLLENTNAKVTVHILHDDTLTQDNRDKFSYVAGQYNQRVEFYNVERLCADKLAEMVALVPTVKTSRVSVGAFYRLLIPQLLPKDVAKCIYLDSDMLVNLDISELWRVELDDKPLAAVREMNANAYNYETFDAAQKYLLSEGLVEYDDYFNSGLLVMNLTYLRQAEKFIMSGVKWRGEHPQCNCFDQDIWNYLFSKDYVELPAKFDRFICNERSQGVTETTNAIYHCTSPTLLLDTDDAFNRLWFDYFIKSPWFDARTIGRLCAGFRQIHTGLKTALINLSSAMSGKTRAFFVIAENCDAVREIFSVRDDEEIILADDKDAIPNLVYAMGRAGGKKIFFVFVPNFSGVSELLTKIDFVEGSDFVNGFEFLSEAQGFPLDSYPLVQAM